MDDAECLRIGALTHDAHGLVFSFLTCGERLQQASSCRTFRHLMRDDPTLMRPCLSTHCARMRCLMHANAPGLACQSWLQKLGVQVGSSAEPDKLTSSNHLIVKLAGIRGEPLHTAAAEHLGIRLTPLGIEQLTEGLTGIRAQWHRGAELLEACALSCLRAAGREFTAISAANTRAIFQMALFAVTEMATERIWPQMGEAEFKRELITCVKKLDSAMGALMEELDETVTDEVDMWELRMLCLGQSDSKRFDMGGVLDSLAEKPFFVPSARASRDSEILLTDQVGGPLDSMFNSGGTEGSDDESEGSEGSECEDSDSDLEGVVAKRMPMTGPLPQKWLVWS